MWGRPDRAESRVLIDAYRAEVLREAAASVRALKPAAPEGFTLRPFYVETLIEGYDKAADLIDPDKQD
jgi:hypothetical protein